MPYFCFYIIHADTSPYFSLAFSQKKISLIVGYSGLFYVCTAFLFVIQHVYFVIQRVCCILFLSSVTWPTFIIAYSQGLFVNTTCHIIFLNRAMKCQKITHNHTHTQTLKHPMKMYTLYLFSQLANNFHPSTYFAHLFIQLWASPLLFFFFLFC